MSEKEIREQWIPMCRQGTIIKETRERGDVSFFYVVTAPKFKKFSHDENGIELEGIWFSKPCHVFMDKMLTNTEHIRIHTIACWGSVKLEVSSYEEMLEFYHNDYKNEIREYYEKIKTIKTFIRTFKRTLHSLDDTMNEQYRDMLKLSNKTVCQASSEFSSVAVGISEEA